MQLFEIKNIAEESWRIY